MTESKATTIRKIPRWLVIQVVFVAKVETQHTQIYILFMS